MIDNMINRWAFNNSSQDVNNINSSKCGAVTPQYIIKCQEFFSSEIEGFEDDSSPCISIGRIGGERQATYDSSGEISGDGRIVTWNPVVKMKYGSWAPIIRDYWINGKQLEHIDLKRFISINGTKIIIQELNHTNCFIKIYDQEEDTITFSFCFVTLEDINIAYDHNGNKIGNTASIFNTSTLKSEIK